MVLANWYDAITKKLSPDAVRATIKRLRLISLSSLAFINSKVNSRRQSHDAISAK
jgi:hypothetical protein